MSNNTPRWGIPGTKYPRLTLYYTHLLAVTLGFIIGLWREGGIP